MKDTGLWIGLLLSIPLSILANVFTPGIQRWLDARSRGRALARTKNLEIEYEQVKRYREKREEFHEYLLWTVIRTTFVGALAGIVAGLTVVIPTIFTPEWFFPARLFVAGIARSILYATGQVVSVAGALLIINICRTALGTYYKVSHYDEYEASVQINRKQKIQEIGSEGAV
jgi:hypothetical protein